MPSSPSIVPADTDREIYICWRISVRLTSSGTSQSASTSERLPGPAFDAHRNYPAECLRAIDIAN
jgi:hypothetical protein